MNPAELLNQGIAFHRKGDFVQAEVVYRQLLSIDERHSSAFHLLGVVMMQTKRLQDGVEFLDKALAIKPDYVEALNNRGIALQSLKRFTDALASYEEALALKPDYAEALNNRGNVLKELKRFNDALASYDQALAIKPDHAEAAYNRGNALRELGRVEDALASYDKALAIKPGHADALHNRGVALQALDRPKEALASYDKALAINPGAAETLNNRGNVLQQLKRLEDAILSYDEALAIKPDYAEALNNRGNALQKLRRLDAALASYDQALAIEPDYCDALLNRGNTSRDLGRLDDALASYDRALAIRPDAEALHHRGITLQLLKRHDDALSTYNTALEIRPDFANALNNRGIALHELKRFDEALASYDRALEINPAFAEIFINRGNALQKLDRLGEALASYDKALAIKPNFAEAYDNRGNVLQKLGRLDAALASYDKALAVKPNDPDATFNRSFLLLLRGDLAGGWAGYESRWTRKGAESPKFNLPFPRWRGENIRQKTIIVYEEQGLGDVIQFFRYVRLLVENGATVTFLAPSSLIALLRPSAEGVRVLAEYPAGETFDFQSALLSLPLGFGATLQNIPAQTPYLRAEPDRVQKWKTRIGTQGFKIGIAWQGSKATGVDAGRSLQVAEFSAVSDLPGVRLISLQKNDGVEQLGSLPNGMRVETLGEDYDAGDDAFLDTAAIMETLDLVISSDTSIAHLAGALGRPVWVAIKHVPDWRWMLRRQDSPWYPTMRLFRQKKKDDWRGVFSDIESALRALMNPERQPIDTSAETKLAPISWDEKEQLASGLLGNNFVISLDRTPERLQQFWQANGQIAKFQHFHAIDGALVDRGQLVRSGLLDSEGRFEPGFLGNMLSHLALWEQVAESGKAALICEDDTLLSKFFRVYAETFIGRLRPDWDFILWTWNFDSVIVAEMAPVLCSFVARFDQATMRANAEDYLRANHNPNPLKLKHAFGVCCYSISPAGARKLLGFVRPIRTMQVYIPGLNETINAHTLSGMLNCIYGDINAYIAWPPIAITYNDHQSSTTVKNETPAA